MSYAFIFPGQGSQSLGMLADLASNHAIINEVFAEASDTLGYDLWEIIKKGSIEKLNQTDITQPAMLTAGTAVYRLLTSLKETSPTCMAGHSLGEYTALVASGALSLSQGVDLVAERGRLMQAAVPAGEGAMAAILGLEDEKVIAVCEEFDGIVEAVNFNSPGQVVIAGSKIAVDKILPLMELAGASRVVLLAVGVPSHCSLMKPAADELDKKLAGIEIKIPAVPVLHNVSVSSYQDEDLIKQALVEQLYKPVQWVKTIHKMQEMGVNSLYELGPGKVLFGLNRRIDRKMVTLPILDNLTLEKALATL